LRYYADARRKSRHRLILFTLLKDFAIRRGGSCRNGHECESHPLFPGSESQGHLLRCLLASEFEAGEVGPGRDPAAVCIASIPARGVAPRGLDVVREHGHLRDRDGAATRAGCAGVEDVNAEVLCPQITGLRSPLFTGHDVPWGRDG
jgi:hypothetical protein